MHDGQLRRHSANTRVCYPTEDESKRKSALQSQSDGILDTICGFLFSDALLFVTLTVARLHNDDGHALGELIKGQNDVSASGPINGRPASPLPTKMGGRDSTGPFSHPLDAPPSH